LIIDAHTHIHTRREGFGPAFDARLEALLAAMEQSGVAQAVVLPIDSLVPNELVVDACRAFPDRLIGFASVDPRKGKVAAEDLEFAVKELGLKGLKLHPRLQNLDQTHGEAIVYLVAAARDLGIPVLIDAFYYGAASYLLDPLQLIASLSPAVPHSRIIVAHMGGHKVLDALMIVKQNPNLLMDISFTPLYFEGATVEKDISFAIRKLGPERLLFGSDFPQMDMRKSLDKALKLLDGAGFDARQKDLVLGSNARELLAI